MYTYIYTYMYIYVQTYIYTHIHTHTHTHIYIYIYIYTSMKKDIVIDEEMQYTEQIKDIGKGIISLILVKEYKINNFNNHRELKFY